MHISKIILLFFVLFMAVAAMAVEAAPKEAPTDADKALAAKAIQLAEKCRDNLGREQSNFLLNDWPRYSVKFLAGEAVANHKQLVEARNRVTGFIEVLDKAKNWPQPPKMKIPYTKKAPVIDGKLDDKVWKKAWNSTDYYELNSDKLVKTPKQTWRMMWDEQYLYMSADCADTDIISPVLPRDGEVYNYDCVELFVMPDFANAEYWELEFGVTGSIYDSLCKKNLDHWGGVNNTKAEMTGLKAAIVTNGTANKSDDKDTGYTVEIAVPFSQLPGYVADSKLKSGQQMRVLLARMDKNTEDFKPYAAWPLLSWTHNIWNYATLELKK